MRYSQFGQRDALSRADGINEPELMSVNLVRLPKGSCGSVWRGDVLRMSSLHAGIYIYPTARLGRTHPGIPILPGPK
jgi:hypothetical protein